MSEALNGVKLVSVILSTAALLVLLGMKIDNMDNRIAEKASSKELVALQNRFVTESLRTVSFRNKIYDKLARIDSATQKTNHCLQDMIFGDKPRGCQ